MDEQKTGPVEWSVASGLGVAAILSGVLTHKWMICFILLGLLLLLVGGYLAFRWWKRRRSEQSFSGDMDQQGGNANVRSAEKKAQLDQLRKAFKGGTDVYKKRKKDIYSVPWYLMIGTPGSGKTEAIRHSELQFPPGLSDPLAGVGGTINMNWWFTNHGVILDTAGKMVFPEVGGAGKSSEWDEFLKLLRKHRPACPINGLFLALDVDKMIKDSSEAIGKKASQVAQQLDRIQRSLDVRFPVYLLVTKSDFLTGFKEFFDGINDPLLQNQILGWSNQGALDDPVDPDAIERQLRELVEIIKRRRLAVLRAPVNLDLNQNRRLDCTDAMFAFPESLERLIPRLKRYLQIIFSSGEFSAKPVFLRGIYFTSSMQQNGDLDEALAEFLGVQVSELPASNVQETAKSYFLRDLFIDKAFQERLVTNASNTRRMRRNRLLILSGLAALTLGALVAFSWLGYRAFDKAVGQEKLVWEENSNQWMEVSGVPGGFWHPIVVLSNDNQWHYTGEDHPFTSTFKDSSLADFHVLLQNLVSQASNNVPFIFRPLRKLKGDLNFKGGQRVLVEHSVLLPLLEGVRTKLAAFKVPAAQDTDAAIRLRKALECLIQTQADIDAGPRSLSAADAQQKMASFITPLLQFVVNTNLSVDSKLVGACAWTYSAGGDGDKQWPPKNLLRGTTLATDAAMNNGLDCLIDQVRKNQQKVEDDLLSLTALCSSLSTLAHAEDALYADSLNDCALTQEHIAAWATAAEALRSSLKQARQQGVLGLDSSADLLQSAVSSIELKNSAASSEAFTGILTSAETGIQAGHRQWFADIKSKCQASAGNTQSKVESALVNYRRYLSNWDADFLAAGDGSKSYFEQRDELYRKAFELRSPDTAVPVGTLQDTRKTWQQRLTSIRSEIERYKGPTARQLQVVCNCAIRESDTRGLDALLTSYKDGAIKRLSQYAFANPMTFDVMTEAYVFLTNLDNDLGRQGMSDLPILWQDKLAAIRTEDADPTRQKIILGYTNWLANQLSFNPDDIRPLQPYLSFRDRWGDFASNQLASSVVRYFPAEPVVQLQQWAVKEAGRRLDGYAATCTARFRQEVGFPVILSSVKQMKREDISGLKDELNQRAAEFKEIRERDGGESQSFATLKERVMLMSQVVAALATTGKLAAYPQAEGAQNQCPYAHVTTGNHYEQLDLGKTEKHAALPDLSGSLGINVTSRPDPDDTSATLYYTTKWPNWGALHLLNLPDVRFDAGKWVVPLPVRNPDGSKPADGNVYLEVEFDQPQPPSLDRWKSLSLPPP